MQLKFREPLVADLDPQVQPHAGCIDGYLGRKQQVWVITPDGNGGMAVGCDPRLLDI